MTAFDQEIMARTALGEARGEGQNGMIAVMWTGMNRFTSKHWYSGYTIAGTFLMPKQYSCWNDGDSNRQYCADVTEEIGLFASALQWADFVLKGMSVDPTLGATHYVNLSVAQPSWLAKAERTVQIGNHTFYKVA